MLQELQTILGGKPLPIDPTTERSRRRPDAARRLPLFPPFKNATDDTSRRPAEALGDGGDTSRRPGEALFPGVEFVEFPPSRLFASPLSADGQRSPQRRQFVRFADEPSELENGVVDGPGGVVRFPRPVTVAPPAPTARPTPAPSLRILGGLRPVLGADAENGKRGAHVVQSLDHNGQLVTHVLSSTRPTLDRARPAPGDIKLPAASQRRDQL
ncbi:uncharacterized protein LOC119091921, partial [Pollicipes pollicipes]|uniref:uncharacterized protein LOC119091921 n=1 Tax=Pollicipes pollicipes TaxID=41117 RepID=UPI00188580A1